MFMADVKKIYDLKYGGGGGGGYQTPGAVFKQLRRKLFQKQKNTSIVVFLGPRFAFLDADPDPRTKLNVDPQHGTKQTFITRINT
jgi:hypothetical protein